MNLENLYKIYFKIYTKTNFSNFNFNYISSRFTKLYLYLSAMLFIFGAILFSFNNNEYISKVGSILNGLVFMILAYLYYEKYFKEFKKSFMQYHNLKEEKNIDYVFYDVYATLKSDNNFINNKKFLSDLSDIEIHKKNFFDNPIVLIIVSMLIAIFGIIITNVTAETLVEITITLVLILLAYNFLYTRSQHFGRNKHDSFKLFLLKIYINITIINLLY